MQFSKLLPKWGSIRDREEIALIEETTRVATSPEESAVRRLSDSQLRKESKRRHILVSAISATCSILTMILAAWMQFALAPVYSFLLIVVLLGANISFVLYLFRWMAAPAKEAARRRKKSVLEMLGVTPQSES